MPFSSLVAWPQSAPCLPYCFDNQTPGSPPSPSIACTISCVSEQNTTVWSLSAARIPDILANTFRVLVVQDFESVAIEDGDDGAGEVGGRGESRKDDIEEKENWERKQLQQSHTWGKPHVGH
jgi:hypothetical protein